MKATTRRLTVERRRAQVSVRCSKKKDVLRMALRGQALDAIGNPASAQSLARLVRDTKSAYLSRQLQVVPNVVKRCGA